ncbi:MAG: hypothetical protein OEY56_04245 [Cyclobacteriaceae bacterium]|nr:hypothetical protein [Cyclobacteriaceae bacterium]
MNRLFLLLGFLIFCVSAFAQEKDGLSVPRPSISGRFILSGSPRSVNINFVGSSITYTKGEGSFSLSLMPTISFRKDVPASATATQKPFVRPGFSIGPLLQVKRFLFAMPVFYQDDAWHLYGGIGYTIGK